jgi:transcriptional regulator GlxA family with amidase domain
MIVKPAEHQSPAERNEATALAPVKVGVLLLDGFPWVEYALVIDSLRTANQFLGKSLHDCKTVSLHGG